MRPHSLIEALRSRTTERAGRRAFLFLDSHGNEAAELSAGELDRRARSVAAALDRHGARGERALLLFPPGLDFVVAFLGCLRAGVVAVPAYPPRPRRSQPRLQAIVRDARARFVLAPSTIVEGAGQLCASIPELEGSVWLAIEDISSGGEAWEGPDPEPDAPAFLQYTSGSTSDPRGVVVTHANLIHNEEAIRLGFGQTEESVVVGWLPLYHDMGLIGNVLQPLYAGATAVLLSPLAFLQRPRLWLETIDLYHGTTSGGPNFAYDLCVRKIGDADRAGLDLSSWRVAFNGAEPVHAETLERFSSAFAPCGFRREAFFPCYGLAEATLFVAGGDPAVPPVVRAFHGEGLAGHNALEASSEQAGARFLVGCGRPSSGQRIAVVDPASGAPCAPGRIGEIWIAGPSVAAGYWGWPEDCERLFRARTAGGDGPFLRTGDLGFLAADGELFVTGRLKDLIILRGRNYYPQDIERTAARVDPALRPDGGAAFSIERDGTERLVVAQEVEHGRAGAPDLAELAEAVRRAVADEHEVAVEEVVLLRSGTLPKTTSGKVRRQACRAEYLEGKLIVVGRSGLAADRDEQKSTVGIDEIGSLDPAAIRALVAAEAARVLRLDRGRLAPDRSLAELGLDSLAAVELKTGLEERAGVSLSLSWLLSGASLASVAEEVLVGWAPRPAAGPGVEIGAPLGEHPLSAGQEALWFSDRLAPEAAVYNVATAVRVEGGLDPEALGRSLQALADRHPALRTTFSFRLGEPRQTVHEHLAVDFRVEPSAAKAAEIPIVAEAYWPFDLERGSLLRARIWPLEGGGWLLLLAVHHLVTDFWSLGVLVRELTALYVEAVGQGSARLAPLPLGYTDYVRWQRNLLAGERGERLWAFWCQKLAGDLPVLELTTDRPRPALQTYAGLSCGLRLAPELTDRLRGLGLASGTTLFVTLLAGFQTLLARCSGQDEVVIGSPTAGRDAAPFLGVMGYFVNPVALRVSSAGDPTWRDLLSSVKAVCLAAFEHQDLPFAVVAERLHPERDPGRSPVFQTLFAFQKSQRPEERSLAELALGTGEARIALADLELIAVPLEECRAPFDLTLMAADAEAGLPIVLQINRDLFDPTTAERLLQAFENLLRTLAEDPDARVSAAELLGDAERRQLEAWNRTTVELPHGLCLPDLFAVQAERTPEREALIAGSERLTYRELSRRTEALARRLRVFGVGPESRVGVSAGRSADLVVTLLAVLRAGGAYVPLDPVQPAERLAWMLDDSGAEVLLVDERHAPGLLAAGVPARCRVVFLDRLAELVNAEGGISGRGEPIQPENLAYLIYTSGSTGRPKGVAIEHRSAVTFVQWARQVFTDAELSGVLAATSIGFDLFVFELFVPLSWGGRVILAENALAFPGLPAAGEVQLLNTVPSVLAELIRGEDGLELPGSVTTINLAGEPLPRSLVRAIHEKHPAVQVLNLYGPSEDTTYSTFAVIPPGGEQAPSIGRPIANTRAHVLDRGMRQVPVGTRGELYLGGQGLARGYQGRPDLTAERFIPDPFATGARLYRTGDLARWRPDGELEFLGRIDHQVKIRGVRIEPVEIEAALLSRPGVREAVVLPQGERGDRRLIAYVVAEAGAEVQESALREALLGRLPRAMVPAAFVLLPGLPLTPNGKLDRRALARLAPEPAARGGAEPAAPRSPVEELLAGIWEEVLGLEQVGSGDDFFALGGHSLLALRVQARVRERLGAELPLAAFFQYPTLGAQARRLAVRKVDARPPLSPSPRQRTVFPLSFAQERLWFLERLESGTAVYHMAGGTRLMGPLDVAALGRAVCEVARRHDALRARFWEEDAVPVQEIAPVTLSSPELPVICLAGLDPAAQETEAERLARAQTRRPFDLENEPPLRLVLLRREPCLHDLLVTLHHIAADEESLTILARELAALYDAFVTGRPLRLPELPLRSVDFALWQREWLVGEVLERRLAWWRKQLADLPIVEVTTDRPRPEARSSKGDVVTTVLSSTLVNTLTGLGRQEGVTLFMVLLAGFQAVLERISGQPEVPVGCPVSSRDRELLLPMIGFLVNTLVLRASSTAAPSFGGFLRLVREVTVEAYEHSDVPFELLVQALQPERALGRNPLFESAFALQRPPRGWRLGDLTFAPRIVPTGTAKFDLTLFGVEEEGKLSLVLEYAMDLFDRPTPMRLLGHLETLLAAGAAEPTRPLADLPFLTPAERQQVLEWSLGEIHTRPEPSADQEPADPVERLIAWPIGRPRVNVEAHVLDRDLRPVGVGTPGDLYLGGSGLAQEDQERPDLTTERFLPDPSGRHPGARLYRTGERVRFRSDGRIERLGRSDEVPMTARGNRRPVPRPGEGMPRVLVTPRTPTEEMLAEIWAGVLEHSQVSIHDDFFGLGGHSFLAARLMARIRKSLGVELPLSVLFTRPTIAQLAAEVDRARRLLGSGEMEALLGAPPLIPHADDGSAPPLSFAQEQLWFIDRLEPGSPVYNLPTAVRLDGALDCSALRRALTKLIERQAVLRTTLGAADGRPIQVVARHLAPALPEIDFMALVPALREAAATRQVAAEALVPFDLAAGPLFRTTLLRMDEDWHLLLVTFHHSITDGWSLRIFYEELGALYAAAVTGEEPALPALPVQYTDFAFWQRERLRGAVLDRLLDYWRQRLAGAPAALDMPFDRPRLPVQTYDGTSQLLEIEGEVAEILRTFARDESATLFMTLIAAYATLLRRLSGEHDVVVGTPTANRAHPELEPLIGFFANTMPLRVELSGDPTFRELVGRVRTAALADYVHEEMPFEKIVEELKPERDLSHHPIYQVVFALETSARPDRLNLPGLRMTPLPATEGTAKFDLALYMEDRGGRLAGLLETNRDLIDRSTAERWLRHFAALAAAGARDPERRLSELPFLGLIERHQLLVEVRDNCMRSARGQRRWIESTLANLAPWVDAGELYLLDDTLAPVPLGVPGEIHLGDGLLDRIHPDLTVAPEQLVPNPFSAVPGARLFRAGDCARALPGSHLELLGRIDQRVRLRGYRVDLWIIEATLAEHPAVDAAVVTLRADRPGEERLVAYVTGRPDCSIPGGEELRSFVGERLPQYMLPGVFVALGDLPQTAAGKLDLDALPAPQESEDLGAEPMAPVDDAGKIVAEIWQELLGVQQIDLRDNFFALGGHSLLLLPLQERVQERFGIHLPVVELFKFPTAGALAAHLRKAQAASHPVAPESLTTKIQERAARSRAGGGRGRFVEARRRVQAASRPPVPASAPIPIRDPLAEEEKAD
ncbi:MAG TPA: amino acid adenylation domain-containing protein [Thermoanaerobaculia bacterium]|nr:amino acid adenylation domain-containing protein [Thermoanaerobaculia bacterium]